jgi:ferric-dicitrate binding protein FerR (iron transport regulator)
MNTEEARLYIARYVSGEISPGERGAFVQWLEQASVVELEKITDQFEALEEQWPLVVEEPSSIWVDQLEEKLDKADHDAKKAPVKKMRPGRFVWKAVGAAAAVILVAGGIYEWQSRPAGVAPGLSPEKPAEVLSDRVLSVRRGEVQRNLVLPDGSKVWLNSASSLKYPRSFAGADRTVELSGEAYFEVAKNASMPFRVKVRDMQIEVLGTRFNISAYNEDKIGKTSLLEGAVRVTRDKETTVLGPGEQAEINYPLAGNSMRMVRGFDQERILAWKNGFLEFEKDDLQTVMNEISRSYDLDVVYADKDHMPVTHYTGKFSRKDNVQQIIKELEFQHIHCKIEGKIIKVLP